MRHHTFARTLSVCALAAALASGAYGCVYDNRCVGADVVRGADGKCRPTGMTDGGGADAGNRDAGGFDAGDFDAGDFDAGDFDAGVVDDAGITEKVAQIAVGAAHVCARTNLGRLFCRGTNVAGQLATGDISTHDGPVLIDLGSTVRSVVGNHTTVCAQTEAPAVYCWGGNGDGEVGDGSGAAQVTTPAMIGSFTTSVLASSFANTCFAGLATNLQCWGRNDSGQLGFDTGGTDVNVPGTDGQMDRGGGMMGPIEMATEVVLADRHMCFVTHGLMYCVGSNTHAQLGFAGPMISLAAQVPGLTDVTSIAAASSHTCAVAGGQVFCWGENVHGEADPANVGVDVTTPTMISGLPSAARQVVATAESSCALLDSNDVWCWGWRQHGVIGDGMAVADVNVGPTQVAISNVQSLSSSFVWLTCALDFDANVSCWGADAITLLSASEMTRVFPDFVSVHESPFLVPMIP